MDISAVLSKLFIFIGLMLVGYFYSRAGRVDRSFAGSANKLLVDVFLPATILGSVLNNNPRLTGGELAEVMLLLTGSIVIPYLISFAVIRFVKVDEDRRPVLFLLTCVCNNIFIGLPFAEGYIGNDAVFYFAMSCIPFNLILFTVGTWKMTKGETALSRLKDILSPLVIACLLALVIFLLNPPVPKFIREFISTASGVTLPLSMLVIGASLGSVRIADAFVHPILYLVSFIKLLIMPLAVFFILRLFTDSIPVLMSCVIIAASPCGMVCTALSIRYERDAVFSSEGVMLSTILSMITIPLLVSVLF